MNQGQPEFSEDELDSLRVGEEAMFSLNNRDSGVSLTPEELEKTLHWITT